MKICRDCKYNRKQFFDSDRCLKSRKVESPDMVTGEVVIIYSPSWHERFYSDCIPAGLLWEPSLWYKLKQWLGLVGRNP
jgi:hypothetical protein